MTGLCSGVCPVAEKEGESRRRGAQLVQENRRAIEENTPLTAVNHAQMCVLEIYATEAKIREASRIPGPGTRGGYEPASALLLLYTIATFCASTEWGERATVAAQGREIMTYQQPDDPYQQQSRPSFTPHQQGQPPYTPPQGQQAPYQQPRGPYYAQGAIQPAVQDQRRYPPDPQSYPPQAPQAGHRARRQAGGKQYSLRGAESFWYVLGCIAMGAAYFSKIPGKKAACEVFSELQLDGQGSSRGYSLRGMEGFWYVLMCLGFGTGYFAKVSAKKALWELVRMVQSSPGEYAGAISRALSGAAPPYPPGF